MSVLVSGSLAYDYIMDFPDSFRNHILEDQLHILNVCFVVDQLKKNFGGTAGNIAHTMAMLGGEPHVFGALGTDAGEYIDALKKRGIDTGNIVVSKEKLSSSAHITTDKDDSQVTAFYPGAGDEALSLDVSTMKEKVDFAIIAPAHKDVMVAHALACHNAEIPFCFDPGQQITALSPQELMGAIGQAHALIANDYEMKLIQEKTGWHADNMLEHVELLITTLGEKGSIITNKTGRVEIDPCPANSVEDPTGAGDAYRAGFFWAYSEGFDIESCGQIGSVAATYAVEHYGTQKHEFTREEFEKRYQETYGSPMSRKI